MSREAHVRFCESRAVRFPPATRLDNPICLWPSAVEKVGLSEHELGLTLCSGLRDR